VNVVTARKWRVKSIAAFREGRRGIGPAAIVRRNSRRVAEQRILDSGIKGAIKQPSSARLRNAFVRVVVALAGTSSWGKG
jgi:hypothetical protein